MQTLLLFLIVLLSVVICALAGFWFFRRDPVLKRKASLPQVAPRAAESDPWTLAARPSRDGA